MLDVVERLGLYHGIESLSQAGSLAELGQAGGVQQVVQRRLSRQHYGDDPAVAGVDAGQQAQFLQRGRTQVLGLVDDDDNVLSVPVLFQEVGPQGVQQHDLLFPVVWHAKLRQKRLQQLNMERVVWTSLAVT